MSASEQGQGMILVDGFVNTVVNPLDPVIGQNILFGFLIGDPLRAFPAQSKSRVPVMPLATTGQFPTAAAG